MISLKEEERRSRVPRRELLDIASNDDEGVMRQDENKYRSARE